MPKSTRPPQPPPRRSRLGQHLPLLLILFLFTLLVLYQSVRLPLGEADDETDHYQYLRFVARTGHPPLTQAERQAAGFKGGLAPLYYWLVAWPVALVGDETPPDVRRVDARPERHIPNDGLGINHVLHTLDEGWPWRGQVLAWHLVRLLSLPMGWLTLLATYGLARRLLPGQQWVAIGAVAFVAVLPRFVSSSAVINDDNLVFAQIGLLLLVQVVILQQGRRASPWLFALAGGLFGLALLTKYFSLILVPELLFTMVVYYFMTRARHPAGAKPFMPYLVFLLALLLVAGPWFAFIIVRFNRVAELGLMPGLAAALGEPQVTEGLAGLLAGQSVRPVAATYGLLDWFSLLYRSFWFEYGWMQLFAPTWVYVLFGLFLLAALAGLGLRMVSLAAGWKLSPVHFLLLLHLALFVLVVLARYVLSATIDTGQGRHLYPALPVIALAVALGLVYLYRLARRARPALLLVPGLLYLLPATFCLLPDLFILPHYRYLPVTATPPELMPIRYRQAGPIAPGLFLAGFDVENSATAGTALPVTLYWQAETEASQDYLVSLCLQTAAGRPAGCWRGHFVDGRYPARAWEVGDTIIDTVFIPIPACDRPAGQDYRLRLEVWPLAAGAARPVLAEAPALSRVFDQPALTIRPATTPAGRRAEMWQAGRRLTGPAKIEPGQAITYIDYPVSPDALPPSLQLAGRTDESWQPVPGLETSLDSACTDGDAPLARLSHFIAGPTLPAGVYQTGDDGLVAASLALSGRSRVLAPFEPGLIFTPYLAPLALHLPPAASIDLSAAPVSEPYPLSPGGRLPVTVRWQARHWMAEPLILSLKLLDKEFRVGGERVATLGDRYPNVLWVPGEIVEETYPLRLETAPPGLYRLEMSLLRQDERLAGGYEYIPLARDGLALPDHNLYPVTFRLLDPDHDTAPPQPLSAQVGPAIQLAGYSLDRATATASPHTMELVLYWQSGQRPGADYTVFTQMIGPDGQVWAQWDNPPQAGRYPTSAWTARDRVVDRYTLALRAGAPSGRYRLLAGMYDPATGRRLPVTVDGRPQPDDAIQVTTIDIETES